MEGLVSLDRTDGEEDGTKEDEVKWNSVRRWRSRMGRTSNEVAKTCRADGSERLEEV